MIKILKIFIVFTVCFLSCGKSPKNQVAFDKYRDVNISKCMDVLLVAGHDSIEAKEICTCLIDVTYSIDSTFYRMNEEERKSFFNLHRSRIEFVCDSIRNSSSEQ